MDERKMTEEERFQNSLLDAAAVIHKLGPLCQDIGEMVDLIQKAVGNETQSGNAALLRLLMKQVLGTSKR